MTDTLTLLPGFDGPAVFTQDKLDWLSWLSQSPSAPGIPGDGIGRGGDDAAGPALDFTPAEHALAAAAASRFNGCFFCASVQALFASDPSGRAEDVQRLLDKGVNADLETRWGAIVAASAALSATPGMFGPEHVRRLRRVGLDDTAIADLIDCVARCNEANRLTLSPGEPGSLGEG